MQFNLRLYVLLVIVDNNKKAKPRLNADHITIYVF